MGFSSDRDGIKPGVMHADFEAMAAGVIARHARDADDERLLLEACGLIPYKSGQPPKHDAAKSAVIKHNRPGQH